MGRRCLLCGRKQEVNESYRSFHSFPTDEEQREKWVEIIGGDRLKNVVLKHAIICGDHFDPECMDQQWGRVQLKKGSLPKVITEEVVQNEIVKPIKTTMKNSNAESSSRIAKRGVLSKIRKRRPKILECYPLQDPRQKGVNSDDTMGNCPKVLQFLVPFPKDNSCPSSKNTRGRPTVEECYAHVIEVESVDIPCKRKGLQSELYDESSSGTDHIVHQITRMFEEHCYEGTAAASEHIQNFLEIEKDGGVITTSCGTAAVMEECNEIVPLCRVCACSSDTLINIFSQKGWKQQILSKIHTHLPITVTGQDTLPQYICMDCLEQLNKLHGFVVQCIQADERLKRMHGSEENVCADYDNIDNIKTYSVKDVSDIMTSFWQSKLNIHKSSPEEIDVIDGSDDGGVDGTEVEVIHPEFQSDEEAVQSNADIIDLDADMTSPEFNENDDEVVQLNPEREEDSIYLSLDENEKVLELDGDAVDGSDDRDAIEELITASDKKETSKRLLYRCDACDFVFSSSDELVSHQVYVHNIKIFSCSSCNIVFNASEVSFTQHMATCRKENFNDLSTLSLKVSRSEKLPSKEIELLFSELSSKNAEELNGIRDTTTENYNALKIDEENSALLSQANDNLDENLKKIEVTKIVVSKNNVIKDASTITMCKNKGKFFQVKKEVLNLKEIRNNSKFMCSLCRKKFKTKRQFTLHCASRHKGLDFIDCMVPKYYPCDSCGRKFLHMKSLARHKEAFCASIKKRILCDLCGRKFRHQINLEHHQRRFHTRAKRFLCDFCGKEFKRKKPFIYHLEIHEDKDFICEICGKTVKHIRQHKQQHLKKKTSFTCSICEKTVESKTTLKAHMIAHSGIKNFKCPECPKSFHAKNNYNQHLLQHDAIPRFKCDYCDKRFRRKNRLNAHSKIHLHGTAFTCTICSLTLKSRKDLFAHRRQHTSEEIEQSKSGNETFGTKRKSNNQNDKKYACNMCGKEMRYTSLRVHRLTHTGEKPHRCTYCDASFKYKSSLQVHLYHHSGERPFTCEICDKKFRSQMVLDQHSKIHSSERPFVCNVCGAGFKRRPSLGIHMRVHTGERPYPCRICDRAFKQYSDRNKHEELHYKKGEIGVVFKQCLTIEIPDNTDNIESQLSDNTDNSQMQISESIDNSEIQTCNDTMFTKVL